MCKKDQKKKSQQIFGYNSFYLHVKNVILSPESCSISTAFVERMCFFKKQLNNFLKA